MLTSLINLTTLTHGYRLYIGNRWVYNKQIFYDKEVRIVAFWDRKRKKSHEVFEKKKEKKIREKEQKENHKQKNQKSS